MTAARRREDRLSSPLEAEAAIRAALRRAGGALSVYKLELATGISSKVIRRVVSRLIEAGALRLSIGRRIGYVVELAEAAPERGSGSGQVAGHREAPEFRPLDASRVDRLRELAEMTRRRP